MSASHHGPLSLLLAAATILLLGTIRRHLRGTTLLAAWNWSLLAIGAIAAVELASATILRTWPAESNETCRFLAATLALCPGMAVLGAKRPQDRAWKFIVGSLWAVLVLPAVRVLVLPAVATLTLHPAQAWFLLILTTLGGINWLPTRFWLSALLGSAGLSCLLLNQLPLVRRFLGAIAIQDASTRALIGLACLLGASLWASLQLARGGRRAAEPRSYLWLEFRDLFGAFWALRVAERVNAIFSQNRWPIVLGWTRFYGPNPAASPGSLSKEVAAAVDQNFHSLLRRFVDRRWLADHTPPAGIDQDVPS